MRPRPAQMTFTLPQQYRPRYNDSLLQSSSEQDPFPFFDVESEHHLEELLLPPSNSHRTQASFKPSYEQASAPWLHRSSRPKLEEQTFHTLPRHSLTANHGGRPWRQSENFTSVDALPCFDQDGIFFSDLPIDRFEPPKLLISPMCPMDFFVPRLSQSNPAPSVFDDGPRSDITTFWRGLSVDDAHELFFWVRQYERVTQDWEETTAPVSLLQVASEILNQVQYMPDQHFGWFLKSPSPGQMLERFLELSTDEPSLQVSYADHLVVGREFTLTPHLATLPPESARLSTSVDWLTFDASTDSLHGVVPNLNTPYITITIEVKIVHILEGSRKIEHVIRTKLDLPVTVNEKPVKRVSFADISEAGSNDSSPAILRPFFNGLSAMTHVPPAISDSPYDRVDKPQASRDDMPTQVCDKSFYFMVSDSSAATSTSAYREFRPNIQCHRISDGLTELGWNLYDNAFGKDNSTTETIGLPDDLVRFGWRGWENEVAMSKKANDTKSSPPASHGDEAWLHTELGESSSTSQTTTNKEVEFGDPPSPRPDYMSALIDYLSTGPDHLSAGSTDRSDGSSPSEGGLDSSSRGNATTIAKIAESATASKASANSCGSETLYDSVRSQFRRDHQIRQMRCIRIPNDKGKRPALPLDLVKSSSSSWSSDSLESGGHLEGYPTPTESELSRSSSPADLISLAGSDLDETAGGQDLEEDLIAAAIKASLETERAAEHEKEEQEIRKGMLQHEVMNIRRAERYRLFGSSSYDDLFWSSGSGSRSGSGSGSGSGSRTPASGSQDAE